MKFKTDRATFTEAVTWGTKYIPPKPSIPTLAGALINADGGTLSVSCFNYEVSSQIDVTASIDDPGVALVPGKILAEIIKALPNREVAVETTDAYVEILCGNAHFVLPTMPVEDYPALPRTPTAVGSIDAAAFSRAVSQTAPAASKDETVPSLTGIQLEVVGDIMSLMATDRYRMSVTDLKWNPSQRTTETRTLIPARTLAALAKAWGTIGGDIKIGIGNQSDQTKGLVSFSDQHRTCVTRVLDNHLPDLRSLFPTEFSAFVRVRTPDLAQVVRRVSLIAERTSPIWLHADLNGLTVRACGTEAAKASEALACQHSGTAPLQLAFNPNYLLDCLSAISTPTMTLAVPPDGQRALITGGDLNGHVNELTGYRHVIQPIRQSI